MSYERTVVVVADSLLLNHGSSFLGPQGEGTFVVASVVVLLLLNHGLRSPLPLIEWTVAVFVDLLL